MAAAAGEDDAAWERAIAAASKNAASSSAPKTLTLDGAVKSSTGRLPSPALLERVASSLEQLSVAGARLSSLAGLPRLPALRRLSLPDNRLSGGGPLSAIAKACGATLRHLDLGNNRFSDVEELAPLADLKIETLDLYQCPVTKVKGYREAMFSMVRSLKYLDGADAEGNERLETDDEEDDEDEEEEGDEEEGGEEGEGGEEEEEGEEQDGEEGEEDEDDGVEGEGDDEEGDEEVEDEEDEAKDDDVDADVQDKSNGSKGAPGSSVPSKRKRDNEDDTNGDK